jgi:hypothetical protein
LEYQDAASTFIKIINFSQYPELQRRMEELQKSKPMPDKVENCLVFKTCLNEDKMPEEKKSQHAVKLNNTIQYIIIILIYNPKRIKKKTERKSRNNKQHYFPANK